MHRKGGRKISMDSLEISMGLLPIGTWLYKPPLMPDAGGLAGACGTIRLAAGVVSDDRSSPPFFTRKLIGNP
jgi:hypothetical protein